MPNNLQNVRRGSWVALLLAGAIQGWLFRHSISPDGVAYLDLSDAIVGWRPSELLNGYWSPLYPGVVGLLRVVVSPTPFGAPYWEFALLHVVSFLGFALSLAAFEWFLRTLDTESADWGDTGRPFATASGLVAAYALFGIASLGMISVAGTVPDFFLAAAMFAAFASALRLRADATDRRAAVRLGLALAVGALAKSIGFWIGATVILVLALTSWRRGGRGAVVTSVSVFVAVTLPWVVALSVTLGRPTLGRTGALNYSWYVNEQQPPNTGALPRLAMPREALPVRGISLAPHGRGTDPLWYDPARWHHDVQPRFSAAQQWKRLSWSFGYYAYVAAPLLLVGAAIGAAASWRELTLTLRRSAPVLVPAGAALLAYALVYTTSRHVAVFGLSAALMLAAAFPRDGALNAARLAVAFGATLFTIEALAPAGLRSMVLVAYALALFMVAWVWLPPLPPVGRAAFSLVVVPVVWMVPLMPAWLARGLPLVFGVAMWAGASLATTASDFAQAMRRTFSIAAVVAMAVPTIAFGIAAVQRARGAPSVTAHAEWSAAQKLIGAGVPVGSRIALLGNPGTAGWARLARYQIVAIVPDEQVAAFTSLSDAERARVMRAFSEAGVVRLVARPTP